MNITAKSKSHTSPISQIDLCRTPFKFFTLFSYKIIIIKCLIDRSFKNCNNWNSFQNDIENIKSNLIKDAYPPFLIDRVVIKNLDNTFSTNQNLMQLKI